MVVRCLIEATMTPPELLSVIGHRVVVPAERPTPVIQRRAGEGRRNRSTTVYEKAEGSKMSDRFWDEVAPLQAAGRIEEGTMFGFRCVRAGEAFVAMPRLESDRMVIELPAVRVSHLFASGVGAPVAPAGKVFRERVEIAATEDWWP